MLPYEKVWRTDARDARSHGDGPPRPRFAGEQMITTAILALNQPAKMKVCFIRNGGPPITEFGGRLNSVADRLRDYNFDVVEKDLSGTWAMQAMQQQQEAAPEPSEQDNRRRSVDYRRRARPAEPDDRRAARQQRTKSAEHLAHGKHWLDGKKVDGGSVFMLFIPRGDAMSAALSPFVITARTDAMAVHKFIKAEGAASSDIVSSALHTPFIFTIKEWGDHPITRSLASLQGILLQAAPIEVKPADGVVNAPLIPVPGAPGAPECWGETDTASIDAGPKFHDGDIAPPLYVGAAAENRARRVVCMGSEPSFIGSTGDMSNNIVDFPDQEMLEKQRILVPVFPGDAEFFMNSVFWLSHQGNDDCHQPRSDDRQPNRRHDQPRATVLAHRCAVDRFARIGVNRRRLGVFFPARLKKIKSRFSDGPEGRA